MTIKEKGYSHWDGEFLVRKFPWWPITRYGIKLTFMRKFFKLTLPMSLLPAVFFLGLIYVSERLEDFPFLRGEVVQLLQINPNFFKTYLTQGFMLFIMLMIVILCGASLISDDLKHNSLQLYFSRPIKKKDYLLGKIAVIVFFLFIITLIPGLVFFIMKLVFSGSLKFFLSYPWLPLSIIGYSFIVTGFFSFYALLLSSLSKNRRLVAILIFGIYFLSDIIYLIFRSEFRSHYFSLVSLRANLQQVGAHIFGQKTPYDIPWIFSFLVLLGICVFAGFVLRSKVKGVEIVK
ncbi:MAG: ABC transporter permease subunit [Candidatus Aminicenantes bacterium]|nr:ABC transporter permease subunit [Candidatus Aminicenantes bacterium]